MTTYLYRAIALENDTDNVDGEPNFYVGMPLGRSSGYLSRSSAVAAGENSGIEFVIVRSEPVVFNLPPNALKLIRIADLLEELAQLTG
jgi:hypothetical protein